MALAFGFLTADAVVFTDHLQQYALPSFAVLIYCLGKVVVQNLYRKLYKGRRNTQLKIVVIYADGSIHS